MFKNRLLRALLAPFFMFIDDDEAAAIARGDTFTGTEEEDPEAAAAAAAAKLAEEEAAAAAKKAEEEAAAAKKAEEGAAAKKDGAKTEKTEQDDGKKKDTRIPLSRHEQILAKERERTAALQVELDKVRKQEEKVQSDKFLTENEAKLEDLEDKYNAAMVDGKTDEARKLMREIRTIERGISDHKADVRANAAAAQAIETIRYDTIVERIEAAYPQMVPGSEAYDKDAVAEVLELKDAYQLKGYTPSDALQKAVKYVLGAATTKQKTATEVTPNVDEDKVAEKVREQRAQDATKKAVDAAKSTPPSTAKTGTDSDKLGGTLDAKAVMKMKYEDFAKLDEETLARMRGDTV